MKITDVQLYAIMWINFTSRKLSQGRQTQKNQLHFIYNVKTMYIHIYIYEYTHTFIFRNVVLSLDRG